MASFKLIPVNFKSFVLKTSITAHSITPQGRVERKDGQIQKILLLLKLNVLLKLNELLQRIED